MPSIAQLESLLSLDPNDPFVHYGLGQEHGKAGNHLEAIACYDTVLSLDPTYCYAAFFKAQSLGELGRNDEAKETLRGGIEQAMKLQDAKAVSELRGLLEALE